MSSSRESHLRRLKNIAAGLTPEGFHICDGYFAHATAFVIIFLIGAIFKTLADWRVAVAHEGVRDDLHRIAEAQDRAYPPSPVHLVSRCLGGEHAGEISRGQCDDPADVGITSSHRVLFFHPKDKTATVCLKASEVGVVAAYESCEDFK